VLDAFLILLLDTLLGKMVWSFTCYIHNAMANYEQFFYVSMFLCASEYFTWENGLELHRLHPQCDGQLLAVILCFARLFHGLHNCNGSVFLVLSIEVPYSPLIDWIKASFAVSCSSDLHAVIWVAGICIISICFNCQKQLRNLSQYHIDLRRPFSVAIHCQKVTVDKFL